MRLGYTIIYVSNVQETVHFYEKAFGITCKFVHESQTYAEMETGATTLAFASEEMMKELIPFALNRKNREPAGVEIAFVCENVEEQFNKAVSVGAKSLLSPMQKPWGQTVSYVKDCNGCLVEICSPVTG